MKADMPRVVFFSFQQSCYGISCRTGLWLGCCCCCWCCCCCSCWCFCCSCYWCWWKAVVPFWAPKMSVELLGGRPCRVIGGCMDTSTQDSCVSASKGIQYSVLVASFPYRYNIFALNCWKSARGASWKVAYSHIKGSPNNESSRNSWWPRFKNLGIWSFLPNKHLRKFQHTVGTCPKPATTCLWRTSGNPFIFGILGYLAPGICSRGPSELSEKTASNGHLVKLAMFF